jgi:hypothetical protein
MRSGFLSYPLRQTAGVPKTRKQQRANKKRRESQARKLAVQAHEQTLWPDSPPPNAQAAPVARDLPGRPGAPHAPGMANFSRTPVSQPPDSLGSASHGGVGNELAGAGVGHTETVQSRRSPAELAELAETLELLVQSGLNLSNAGSEFREHFGAIVDRLVDLDGALASEPIVLGVPSVIRPEAFLCQRLVDLVPRLWENGWQPLDMVHAVRKERNPRVARLAGVLIHAEAAGFSGRGSMPDEWADQLAAIPSTINPELLAKAPLAKWRSYEQLSLADLLQDALLLLGLLKVLPGLTVLCDPPSKWLRSSAARSASQDRSTASNESSPGAAAHGGVVPDASAKTMATIRALLAKAEATTFEAEREVFAAKAQDLMTRYSIDAALLDLRHGEQLGAGVRKRRFHLDNPYATEKCHLLNTVARLNNVKIVYEERFAMATAVGFPTDIELSDLLFTSLLVQAARGLQDLVASAGKGRTSSPAFRRAYWIAYGVRIGERLTEAQAQATHDAEAVHGGALVLVMKEREEAVASVTDELFKNTKKMKSRRLDSDGWHAGRAAAGHANLGTPKARLRS